MAHVDLHEAVGQLNFILTSTSRPRVAPTYEGYLAEQFQRAADAPSWLLLVRAA